MVHGTLPQTNEELPCVWSAVPGHKKHIATKAKPNPADEIESSDADSSDKEGSKIFNNYSSGHESINKEFDKYARFGEADEGENNKTSSVFNFSYRS